MPSLQPIDYTMKNIADPVDSFFVGMKQGEEMRGIRAAREAAKQKAIDDQKLRDQRDASYAELQNLSNNPTVEGVNRYMALNPAIGDKMKPLLESLTDQQKQNYIKQVNDVYAPMVSGRKDIAIENLDKHLEASRNSGNKQAVTSLETMKKMIESADTGQTGDNLAIIGLGSYLSGAMGPENFAKTYGGLGQERRETEEAPSKLSESKSKAESAAVKAKFAESEAVSDLQKKGWDITKIQEDVKIAKENARIAAMNSRISQETNNIKRLELSDKREAAIIERNQAVRDKASEAESALSKVDNMISTIDRAQKTPESVIKRVSGPMASKTPTMSPESANFEELINTMGSQAFVSQIAAMKGMGALSDAEGKKLQASMQNFSLRQSPERLMENIAEMKKMMEKAKANIQKRYGAPVSMGTPSEPTAQRNVTVDY